MDRQSLNVESGPVGEHDDEQLLKVVREGIAETLYVDLDEVVPDATFFNDLEGESIELLELEFRFEKRLGKSPRFKDLFSGVSLETDEQGRLTTAALGELKARYPFLGVAANGPLPTPKELRDSLTVRDITELLKQT